MGRIITLTLMLMLGITSLFASDINTLADAKAEAAKSGKLILIDFMTDW